MTKFPRRGVIRDNCLAMSVVWRTPILARTLLPQIRPRESRDATGNVLFEQVLPSASGITWAHVNGRSSGYFLPETTGAGCAFLDYDNDGWMDLYLVNSGKCDFYSPTPPLRNALYRNNRDGTFTDVTEKAGVGAGGYGQGVAVGDYDGDGLPDIYVTQYGKTILYHNKGYATFTSVTETPGVTPPA